MRFGCCQPIQRAAAVAAAGFEYLECPVVSLRPEGSRAHFEAVIRPAFVQSPLPVETFNVLLPGDIALTGPEVDTGRIGRYLAEAFARIAEVGGELVVFGSGAARSVPEGFDRHRARDQILAFLHTARDLAVPSGLTLVIEPLRVVETNICNTVTEALDLARAVGEPVAALADFYHMREQDEPLEHLVAAGDLLRHIHVADTGRKAPGTGDYPYADFARLLRQAGYDGRVSVECGWGDFDDEAPRARRFLQRVFG